MIPAKNRDGSENRKAMELLRQMVLARAFPDDAGMNRNNRIEEIFDSEKTLDRLCRISGGHARNLMRLLRTCIQKSRDLPISAGSLDLVIRERRNKSAIALMGREWDLLRQVKKTRMLHEYEQYHQLLRNVFVMEYRDEKGSWFDVNPILTEEL